MELKSITNISRYYNLDTLDLIDFEYYFKNVSANNAFDFIMIYDKSEIIFDNKKIPFKYKIDEKGRINSYFKYFNCSFLVPLIDEVYSLDNIWYQEKKNWDRIKKNHSGVLKLEKSKTSFSKNIFENEVYFNLNFVTKNLDSSKLEIKLKAFNINSIIDDTLKYTIISSNEYKKANLDFENYFCDKISESDSGFFYLKKYVIENPKTYNLANVCHYICTRLSNNHDLYYYYFKNRKLDLLTINYNNPDLDFLISKTTKLYDINLVIHNTIYNMDYEKDYYKIKEILIYTLTKIYTDATPRVRKKFHYLADYYLNRQYENKLIEKAFNTSEVKNVIMNIK